MTILADRCDPAAIDVTFDETAMTVVLADGREISTPLEWFPRLRDPTPEQRRRWRLIGRGEGLHWADLDEDVSVNALPGQEGS
ncbi:MAG: DUF2442 domain-containing protein [Roseiarcus sp.]